MASVQRRTWEDKQGKQRTTYRVQIRRAGFPKVTQTFKQRSTAEAWARRTEAELERGEYVADSEARKRDIAALVDRQLEHVKLHRPHDYERQRAVLGWWKERLGRHTLAAIATRPAVLAEARDKLLTEEELSPATVNRYLAALSKAFSNAVQEWHWLRDNPLRNISKPEEPRGRVRFLDDDERRRLLDVCRQSDYRPLYLMVLFALMTGMRRGELCGLRWQDIDLERHAAVLHNTKNGDRRSVPILPEVTDLLREHGKVRRLDNDLVFLSGGASEVWLFDRAWYAALKEARIKDFRFHDLRHTAASYLAMTGSTTAEIAAVLGHRTLQMVKRYAHLSDQHTGAVIERMARKYFG